MAIVDAINLMVEELQLNLSINCLIPIQVYGGTGRLFRAAAARLNGTVDFVDISNVEKIVAAIKKETRLVWLETPTNPTLRMCDIELTVKRIREINRPDIIICVDNTFMTPVFQLPLQYGADLSVHSLTKYINGHSDVVMGAVLTNRKDLHDGLRFLQNGRELNLNCEEGEGRVRNSSRFPS